jgi:hypothetical protein
MQPGAKRVASNETFKSTAHINIFHDHLHVLSTKIVNSIEEIDIRVSLIRLCWSDDDTINGLKHVAWVILINVTFNKGCVLMAINLIVLG